MKQLLLNILQLSPSFLKVFIFKYFKKFSIGENVKFQKGSWLFGNEISIENNVNIGAYTIISSQHINIGKNTTIRNNVQITAIKSIAIGKDCYIDKKVTFGGGQSRHSELIIGNRVKIFERTYINTTRKVTIENEVGIGGRSLIFTHGTWQNTYEGYPYKFGDVTIKKHAWLPWQVFVMPGVTIGENATIGSASLITKDIPNDCFAAGSPAKILKHKESYVQNNKKNKLKVIKEILYECCLDFNFINKTNYIFNDRDLSIRNNNNLIIRYIINSHQIAYESNTLYLIDSTTEIKNNYNYINLDNNTSNIPNKDIFTEYFIHYISNYGIRLKNE
tara:strand:+ start:1341 stop:2339 length:999 start_codon:yes stop_codon:yes gene_type:complete